MAFLVGLLAIAALAIYLDRSYRDICEEYQRRAEWEKNYWRGFALHRIPHEPDWNFPPEWHPPIGRTKF